MKNRSTHSFSTCFQSSTFQTNHLVYHTWFMKQRFIFPFPATNIHAKCQNRYHQIIISPFNYWSDIHSQLAYYSLTITKQLEENVKLYLDVMHKTNKLAFESDMWKKMVKEKTLRPSTERRPLRIHSLRPVPRTITSYSSSIVPHTCFPQKVKTKRIRDRRRLLKTIDNRNRGWCVAVNTVLPQPPILPFNPMRIFYINIQNRFVRGKVLELMILISSHIFWLSVMLWSTIVIVIRTFFLWPIVRFNIVNPFSL